MLAFGATWKGGKGVSSRLKAVASLLRGTNTEYFRYLHKLISLLLIMNLFSLVVHLHLCIYVIL